MRKSTALRSCFLSFSNDTRLLMDNFQSAFTGVSVGESLPHPGTSLRLRRLHTPLGFSMHLSFKRLILYQITKSAACFIGGLVTGAGRRRGCRTSKYFLLGGSPALCPNGGEIGCDFAPVPYKHSSFPDIPFGMPDFKLFCFQPLKSMLSLMKKDDSPFFRSESCNEAY